LAFTYNGLKQLGLDEHSLSTFPDPFRQGMAARAAMLGDTGINHPDHWEDKIASPDLHAVVILFARDQKERERCMKEHQDYLDKNPGVETLSTLLLEAVPPFDYVHEHFGYRDRITTPVIDGKQVDAFVAGNDEDALQTVSELVSTAGFKPIVAGDLPVSRTLENMQLLLIRLGLKYNYNWLAGFKILHH